MKRYWLIVMFVILAISVSSTELRLPSGDTISLTIITSTAGNGTPFNKTGNLIYPSDSTDSLKIPSLTNCNLDTDGNGLLTCGTDATGSDPSAWNGLNLSGWLGFTSERDANSSIVTKNNNTFIQGIKVDNATWANNASGVRCADVYGGTDTNFCVDADSGSTGINNGSSGNFTNINVLTLNGTLLSLFNKSIDLSGYVLLLGAPFSNFKLSNITEYLGSRNSSIPDIVNNGSIFDTIKTTTIGFGLNNSWFTNYSIINFTANYGAMTSQWLRANASDFHGGQNGSLTLASNFTAGTLDAQMQNVTVKNLSIQSINITIGIFQFIQFNSTCSGFRMNSSAPPILSCGG